jgi:hypothetical protein
MADTGRSHDITELYKDLSRERNPIMRENLKRSIRAIKNESGSIRSMRESLIKAHRRGDYKEVKDIHDFISKKQKYQNDR